jgi:hypothetical protein
MTQTKPAFGNCIHASYALALAIVSYALNFEGWDG